MAEWTWVWQRSEWGEWTPRDFAVGEELESAVRRVSKIEQLSERISANDRQQLQAILLEQESITTSQIEGEILDRDSVRSSIARRLGLEYQLEEGRSSAQSTEGIVANLIDATQNYQEPLTHDRLHQWQAALFPTGRNCYGAPIDVGFYRTDPSPMQVVSERRGGRTAKVHYEAPPTHQVPQEMDRFLTWFNSSASKPSYVRAAIATYWFVSIHPYEDGNGRLCRLISDLAIAQAEHHPHRLYSFSGALMSSKQHREAYYGHLESCQKGLRPLGQWVAFFIEAIGDAASQSLVYANDIIRKTQFWDRYRSHDINARQKLLINKVLDEGSEFEGHISNKRYTKILEAAKIHVAPVTSKRDLADLVNKGIMVPTVSSGRNAAYRLNDVIESNIDSSC
jgi:Fic family protein